MNTHIHIHYTHVTRHHLFNLLNSNFMCLSMSTKTQLYLNHAISVYKKKKKKKVREEFKGWRARGKYIGTKMYLTLKGSELLL